MTADYAYGAHWDEKFRTRRWGRYPPEDLVRFIMRHYADADRAQVKILEIGSGTGANLWFLHREGFAVAGIDGAAAGVEITRERLATENAGMNPVAPDLRAGNFAKLPWNDAAFDVVIDIFALYANDLATIRTTLAEVCRVLKPGGYFYAKLWGRATTGYGEGEEIEPGTFKEVGSGPCAGMGLSHFFDRAEIAREFAGFETVTIDRYTRTDTQRGYETEEFACVFRKKG